MQQQLEALARHKPHCPNFCHSGGGPVAAREGPGAGRARQHRRAAPADKALKLVRFGGGGEASIKNIF